MILMARMALMFLLAPMVLVVLKRHKLLWLAIGASGSYVSYGAYSANSSYEALSYRRN